MSPDLKHGNPGSLSILKSCEPHETRPGRPCLASQGLHNTGGARTKGQSHILEQMARVKGYLCLVLSKGETTLAFRLEICILNALAFEGCGKTASG